MIERIAQLRAEGERALAAAASTEEVEQLRVRLLGRKAELPNLLRGVAELPPPERASVGREANAARRALQDGVDARRDALEAGEQAVRLAADRLDLTLPGRPAPAGGLHLLTRTRREIEDVFLGLGFSVLEGREVETVHHNFDALNHDATHPARSRADTFYLAPRGTSTGAADGHGDPRDGGRGDAAPGPDARLLRTHTSPMQIRAMAVMDPPLAVVVPGRVFRPDSDATHTPQFHQVEGLLVDEGITLADLQGTLLAFARAIFGDDREIRLRPHFFPFTEPSVEVDVSCLQCGGTGVLAAGAPTALADGAAAGEAPAGRCGLCRGTGWIEVLGSGMVDPAVLAAVGRPEYDPERVTGFAFGLGVERVAMLRHGLPDLRLLYDNDVRVLEQFA